MKQNTWSRRIGATVALLCLLCGAAGICQETSLATADSSAVKDESQKHFKAALSLFKAEKYDAAAMEFEASDRLYPTKTCVFNLANVYKVTSRYNEALTTLDRLEADFGDVLDNAMKDAAQKMRAEINNLVAILEVTSDPGGAMISVDGREAGHSPLPLRIMVDPGSHTVTATIDDRHIEKTVQVLSRETVAVVLTLPAQEAPLPVAQTQTPPQENTDFSSAPTITQDSAKQRATVEKQKKMRIAAWVSAGVAVVAGIGCGVFYGLAGRNRTDFNEANKTFVSVEEDINPDAPQPDLVARYDAAWSDMQTALSHYDRNRTVGLVSGIAASAFAVTAAALFVASRNKKEQPDAATRVVPAPGGVTISF